MNVLILNQTNPLVFNALFLAEIMKLPLGQFWESVY